jgi:hypothetical protein
MDQRRGRIHGGKTRCVTKRFDCCKMIAAPFLMTASHDFSVDPYPI